MSYASGFSALTEVLPRLTHPDGSPIRVLVLTRIRQSYPEVPVLFLTAKDTVQDRIEGLASGGDDDVTSPSRSRRC